MLNWHLPKQGPISGWSVYVDCLRSVELSPPASLICLLSIFDLSVFFLYLFHNKSIISIEEKCVILAGILLTGKFPNNNYLRKYNTERTQVLVCKLPKFLTSHLHTAVLPAAVDDEIKHNWEFSSRSASGIYGIRLHTSLRMGASSERGGRGK